VWSSMRAIRISPALLTFYFITTTAAAVADGDQPFSALVACLRAATPYVTLPGDAAFTTARLVYNRDNQRRPLAIVEVDLVSQIQGVVACGREARRRVVARSGGHGFEGAAVGDGVIVVDLRRMRSIQVSADNATATVEAGATLEDLYHAAWVKARRGVNAGTCPAVGVSGLLLGGGYGFWSRKYGMACDRVASFDLVTADGTLLRGITAAGPHADLFWASCGSGGGNWGIVTRWVLSLFTPPAAVQTVTVQFPRTSAAALWTAFQRWGHTAPVDVGLKVTFGSHAPPKLIMYSLGADLKKVLAGNDVAALRPSSTGSMRSWR
jgi:FAD/FMN-containing dehydrogenase